MRRLSQQIGLLQHEVGRQVDNKRAWRGQSTNNPLLACVRTYKTAKHWSKYEQISCKQTHQQNESGDHLSTRQNLEIENTQPWPHPGNQAGRPGWEQSEEMG